MVRIMKWLIWTFIYFWKAMSMIFKKKKKKKVNKKWQPYRGDGVASYSFYSIKLKFTF